MSFAISLLSYFFSTFIVNSEYYFSSAMYDIVKKEWRLSISTSVRCDTISGKWIHFKKNTIRGGWIFVDVTMPIQTPQWTDFLICSICCNEYDQLHNPVSLGCGHTLCKLCLSKLQRKQCPYDQVKKCLLQWLRFMCYPYYVIRNFFVYADNFYNRH